MSTKTRKTIEDLYKVAENGKAEIINGELIKMPPTGDFPNRAAGNIYLSLRNIEKLINNGRAYTDNIGYKVNLPNRESFSPDTSFYVGPRAGGKFLAGAPIFAVEV